MSEQSSPEQRTAPDRQDSDHYWANKRESRGSLTSIAERNIIRGHAPYNKQSSISDERYWDDYFFNKRDSRGSSRSGIDREMFTEHANTTSQRSSVDEERRRRQVTPKALHLSWTKIRGSENRPSTSGSGISPTASIDSHGNYPDHSERARDIDPINTPPQPSSQKKEDRQSIMEGKKKAKPDPVHTASPNRRPSAAVGDPKIPKGPKSPLVQQIKNLVRKDPGQKSGSKPNQK